MKKIFSLTSIALLLGAFSFNTATVLPIGGSLPKADHKMKDISGKDVTLKEVAKSKGLLVMFSCNTCPYVIKNQHRTIVIGDYAQKMEVGVAMVNSNEAYRDGDDSFEEMKQYAAGQKYNWKYVLDTNHEIADAFGANRTPECFLFDKDLKLVYHGAIDDNPSDGSNVKREHLREAINQLVAGKEITVKESRSVGCTIKRKS